MLKNGTIYLLDEPTTGLDGVVAKQLQKTLDELSSSATTICITHHLEDLQKAHQILYLDQGKIVERGTFAELITAGGEFAKQVEARKTAGAPPDGLRLQAVLREFSRQPQPHSLVAASVMCTIPCSKIPREVTVDV